MSYYKITENNLERAELGHKRLTLGEGYNSRRSRTNA